MKRREFIALIGVSVAWPAVAQAERQPTLGLLSSGELADWPSIPFERVWRRAATSKAAT
jgi:putative tryptophan/tyrosine transport system substrate-binding protein